MADRLIVGISGASGIVYGIRLLECLKDTPIETHLIMSKAAQLTMSYETDLTHEDVSALADEEHNAGAIDAAPSSGSFKTMGMIVAPCSVRSMSEIATGTTSTLLTRAADVILKERRRLVLMVRETPLHLGHLRTMAQLAEMGAIIAPPVPAFYQRPETIQELIDQSIGRVLDLFDIEVSLTKRWGVDIGRRKGVR